MRKNTGTCIAKTGTEKWYVAQVVGPCPDETKRSLFFQRASMFSSEEAAEIFAEQLEDDNETEYGIYWVDLPNSFTETLGSTARTIEIIRKTIEQYEDGLIPDSEMFLGIIVASTKTLAEKAAND